MVSRLNFFGADRLQPLRSDAEAQVIGLDHWWKFSGPAGVSSILHTSGRCQPNPLVNSPTPERLFARYFTAWL